MTKKLKSRQELLNETENLRARLEAAEDAIRAIHNGEVDAFVVAQSDNVHTIMLKGADYPYRAMVDSMGEGAVTLIENGTIFFCNSRFVEIVQSTFEKLIGSPFQRLIPPEEQARFGELINIPGKNIARGEFRLQTVQGTYIPVQLSAHILETKDVESITIVVTDLTERKLAEQARWEAEHKLNKMFQSVLEGMLVVDLSGKITYANPAATRILEVPNEQLIGMDYYPRELKLIDANRNVYTRDQLSLTIVLRDNCEVNDVEHGILTANGEIKWLSVNASPLLDEKGQLYGAVASFRDVTGHKKDAEALRESYERNALLASLLDQVRNAVIAVDLDGKIFYWNKFAQTLYQWKEEEVIGKPIQEVTVPENSFGIAEKIFESIQQVGYWEGDFLVSRKDGSYFPAQVEDTLIKNTEGVVIGILGVSIDITERKRAEQEIVNLAKFPSENPNPVLRLNRDGILMYANAASEALLGKGGCAVGSTPPQFWRDLAAQGLASRENKTVEIELDRKVYSMVVIPVTEPGYVNFYALDITERKQAEEMLKASETRYRRLFEAAQDGVLLLDADTGEIFDVNPYLIKMVGYSYEEFMGKKLWEIGAFQDIVSNQLAFEELREKGYIRYEDLPLRSKDGQLWNVEFVSNVYLDDQKKVIQCNIRDISERKRAEEVSRIRTQELKMLFDLSRSLADAKNLDQVCDSVNQHSVANVHVTFSRIGLLQGDNLVIRAAYPLRDLDHDLFIGDSKPISALPYCQRVLKGHKAMILQASDPKVGNEERKALLLDHVSSICLVPLRVGKTRDDSGHLLGILMLGEARNESRAPMTPQKLSLIGGIGDQASSAIRRMLLSAETDRRLDNLSALSKIDRAITSGADLNTSLTIVLEQVVRQLNVDAAEVLLLDSSSQTLVFSCGQGFRTKTLASLRLRLGESHAGRAALERALVHVSNLQDPGNLLVSSRLAAENFVSYHAVPLISKGQVNGVLEIFNRTPFKPDDEWLGLLKALAEQASIAIDNVILFDGLTRSNIELTLAYTDTIEGWSRALDLRDKETEGHTLRVTEKTLVLARSFGLRDDELVQIRWGALLHDIGKMGVPDNILLKPGPLTDEEWVLMRNHPTLAYELLSPIHYLRLALDIPYCHHENWDGTGYPRGLKGETIPLSARIFAVVDVWDALTSDRPYRKAWSCEKTIEHIKSGSGTHFDPQVVQTFLLGMDRK